jgi:hypothetical protein
MTTATAYAGACNMLGTATGITATNGNTISGGDGWVNFQDAIGSSGSGSFCVMSNGDYSDVLLLTDFSGLSSIPSGSTITSVSIAVTKEGSVASGTKYIIDLLAAFYQDTGQIGPFTDLAIDASNDSIVTSASYSFVSGDVGKSILVLAGSGWTIGNRATILSVSGGAASVASGAFGPDGLTGGTYIANDAFSTSYMLGSDLRTGGSTKWPTTSAATTYNAGSLPSLATLQSSNWGFVIAADDSQSSSGSQTATVYSAEITVTYTASGSAPGQVTGLSVTNDSTNPTTALDLSWSTPSGSPTSYTIQRASTLGGSFSTLATGVTGTTYVDSTCSPGTEYAYEVAGVNGVGTGTYSSAAANFTDPAAPGSLAATPASGSQINVSWSAPSLGSTVSVVQYTLNRQTNGGSFSTIYTGSKASYSDTGLSAGTTYGYEVDVEVAVNDTSSSGLTGDLTSAFSSVASATTAGPAAPVPLFGLEGTGACPFGVTHPTRRTRIEGVRFQHRHG